MAAFFATLVLEAGVMLVRSIVIVGLVLLHACADPCVDDGLGQKHCPGSATTEGEAGETNGMAETSAADEAGTMAGSEGGSWGGAGAETGAGTTSTGEGTGTGTGGDTCANGVQDGDETDVDCGGSCGKTCNDGDTCNTDADCIGMCVDGTCGGGETACMIQADDNSCQQCLRNECCDRLTICLQDESCRCWFECIMQTNDFDPCRTMCGGSGNEGDVISCANSRCKTADACNPP